MLVRFYYGNYGGLNYSSGVVGGTITETSPPPVDAYDAAFYLHDLAYQSSSKPAVRLFQQTFNSQKLYMT